MNKAILVGRLGQDPELKDINGSQVCKFSVATSEKWTDKNGEKKESTEWHNVVAWGKTAEICSKYLAKGRQVYVEGQIQTRSWDDKETGKKRYATEIKAEKIEFLGDKKDSENQAPVSAQKEPESDW